MAQMTFKRYEIKYMLTRAQREKLLQAMAGHLALDQYGHHTIRNVYFDTDSFLLARRSLEKPLYREKLRVRSYGQARQDSTVFVEVKKKYDGVVYKRRLALPHAAAMAALAAGRPLPANSQIGREIEAFRRLYGPSLGPAMLLTYEREAFSPVDGVDFRLTLDENIRWRTSCMDLGAGVWGSALLDPDQVLMELKTPGGLPLWMVRFLSEQGIRKISFSKYGTAYRHMLEPEAMTGGLTCA